MSIQRIAPQWNRLKNPYIETIRLMYIPVGNTLVRKAIADGIMKMNITFILLIGTNIIHLSEQNNSDMQQCN